MNNSVTEEVEDRSLATEKLKRMVEVVKRYKLLFSVGGAVAVVLVSAAVQYKNQRIEEEFGKTIAEYQKNLLMMGGEISYEELECSGIIETECNLKKIRLSFLGQEQLSINSLKIGDVAKLYRLQELREGKKVSGTIDIDAQGVALPKPLVAQMIASNVSNAFQQSTLEKLERIDLAIKGEFEGDSDRFDTINIEKLMVNNAIMPLTFAMEARNVSTLSIDSMVLDHFSLVMENRAIGEVTYEAVKSFYDLLNAKEKGPFLANFDLKEGDMADRPKATEAINNAIAKRFENDYALTEGKTEKEMIQAIIQLLKGDTDEIVLKGENQNALTMGEIQQALGYSARLKGAEAEKYMKDKFIMSVETQQPFWKKFL